MKNIGIDYRPVIAAPYSGIARQVLGLEEVINDRHDLNALLFSPCSEDNNQRQRLICPIAPSDDRGLHRPMERLSFEYKFLPKELIKHDVNIYIATTNQGLPIWKKPKNFTSILLLHDLFQITLKNDAHKSKLKKLLYRAIDYSSIKLSVRQADYIWTPSEFTKSEIIKLFPSKSDVIRVLPNLVAIKEHKIEERSYYLLPKNYWLLVGTREPRKNIPWFIDVWKAARETNINTPELVVLGDRNDLPSHLRQLNGLTFIENIDDIQLCALYTYAELLWHPSYAEGFGLPVVEALAQGTPVATAYGSSLDEVTPAGLPRFDPYKDTELLKLMAEVANNPIPKNEKYKLWAQQFAMKNYSKNLNQLLDEVLE